MTELYWFLTGMVRYVPNWTVRDGLENLAQDHNMVEWQF